MNGAVRQAGLATLLFDLLTAEEERGAGDRTIDWASIQAELRPLPIGLFGASTGADAALIAAAAPTSSP